jgi:hypothetical protein
MSTLHEGLHSHDLADLVLPLISIDEFESKIGNDALVIGFFVHDEDAANDLNRFIQKSPTLLLDTDVSPAPDAHGYFMVFVELLKNEQTAVNFDSLLAEVSPLTGIDEWQMQVRNRNELLSYSKEEFSHLIKELSAEDTKNSDVNETRNLNVLSYLHNSLLENATIDGDSLVIEGGGTTRSFAISGLIVYEGWLMQNALTDRPVDLNLRSVVGNAAISRMLGEGWSVHSIDDHCIIHADDQELSLVLRHIR